MLKHSRFSPSKRLAKAGEGGLECHPHSESGGWIGNNLSEGFFSAGADVGSHKSPTSGSRREAPGFN